MPGSKLSIVYMEVHVIVTWVLAMKETGSEIITYLGTLQLVRDRTQVRLMLSEPGESPGDGPLLPSPSPHSPIFRGDFGTVFSRMK